MPEKSERALWEITKKLKEGLSGEDFRKIVDECGGNIEVFEKAFGLYEKGEGMSLALFMSSDVKFSYYFAETILDIHDLYQLGVSVFEVESIFRGWLDETIPVLSNNRPIDLIDSFAGREWIRVILTKIEHGNFS